MAKVLFKRISDSSLIDDYDIEDGSFWVTGDGKTFIDYNGERISIAGTPDTEMSDRSTNSVQNNVIKSYVDGLINDTKGEIKWLNSSPSSSFQSQTIELSDDDYDCYEIIAIAGSSGDDALRTISSGKIPAGYGTRLSWSFAGSAGVNVRSRAVNYSSSTSLYFYDGYAAVGTTTYAQNNNVLIPYCVIGYNTGLFS